MRSRTGPTSRIVTSVSVFFLPHHSVKLPAWASSRSALISSLRLLVRSSNTLPASSATSLTAGSAVVRLEGTLVELPRVLPVAAQEVAVGDADLGPGKLLLPDELVAAGERRIGGLDRRWASRSAAPKCPLPSRFSTRASVTSAPASCGTPCSSAGSGWVSGACSGSGKPVPSRMGASTGWVFPVCSWRTCPWSPYPSLPAGRCCISLPPVCVTDDRLASSAGIVRAGSTACACPVRGVRPILGVPLEIASSQPSRLCAFTRCQTTWRNRGGGHGARRDEPLRRRHGRCAARHGDLHRDQRANEPPRDAPDSWLPQVLQAGAWLSLRSQTSSGCLPSCRRQGRSTQSADPTQDLGEQRPRHGDLSELEDDVAAMPPQHPSPLPPNFPSSLPPPLPQYPGLPASRYAGLISDSVRRNAKVAHEVCGGE